jgi:hypothetical protein
MIKTMFIFFNGGGMLHSQWFKNPYDGKTTDIINKVKKFGKVFLYDPVFYISDEKVQEFQKSSKKTYFQNEKVRFGRTLQRNKRISWK